MADLWIFRIVKRGQKRRPKLRDIQHAYLINSQVKILERGFIGRRRQIQQGLRSLKKEKEKVGLLLHGTGGLGKSCLAGKFCERLKGHTLIVVHGKLDAVTLGEALRDGFLRANDKQGLEILKKQEEIPDKLRRLCYSSFQKRQYLILLDDLHENMQVTEEGGFELSSEATSILEALLRFLPYSAKMTQLIITSRYTFTITFGGKDLVKERLESIGLTSFRGADEKKKISELKHIAEFPEPEIRQQLIEAGRGNPRLMEALNILVEEARIKGLDIPSLLSGVKDKHEEFVQELILRKIFESQSKEFKTLLRGSAVYRLPVLKEGIKSVCQELNLRKWEPELENAVRLSLMEEDKSLKSYPRYWVTPLIREEIFRELPEEDRRKCNKVAVEYYQQVLSEAKEYSPILAFELIKHALEAGLEEIAIEESGSRYLPYLRNNLAYREALANGEYILSHVSKKRDEKFGRFIFELGWIYHDIGDAKRAIECYELVLSIDKEVYGDRHPRVAAVLNNLGVAWKALGDHKRAIEYYELALSINKEVYGDRHPDVATNLNNLGLAWYALGDSRRAIGCFLKAYDILREFYGDEHPHTRIVKEWLKCLSVEV